MNAFAATIDVFSFSCRLINAYWGELVGAGELSIATSRGVMPNCRRK